MSKKPEKKRMDSKELLQLKEELRKKLESNECHLTEIKASSKAWKHFRLIKDTATGNSMGFVRCIRCLGIHKHDSSGTGTSHLNKHLETCGVKKTVSESQASSAAAGSSAITTHFTRTTPVTMAMKREMLQAAMAFCALDMRPFEAVRGKGLEFLIETSMRFGIKYGVVPPKEVLPDPTTVSRNVRKVVNNGREHVVPSIKSMIDRGLCAATTDMWTDDHRKTTYTTVTLHYTDSDWNVIRKVLFTCDYPEGKKKTAEGIRDELISKFTEFGFDIDAVKRNVTFVTDQGPNIVKALEPPFKRVSCCAHLLNTILRNLFQPKIINEVCPEVQRTFLATKALVGFLKKTGLSSRLKTAVHQEVETRWNSRLAMLKSVHVNFKDITNICNDRSQQDREKARAINLPVLRTLIQFLEPFKAASDVLEADGCTSNLVLPEYLTLLNFCKTSEAVATADVAADADSDSDFNTQDEESQDEKTSEWSDEEAMDVINPMSQNDLLMYLKGSALKYLKSKFIISDNHRLALLLTPITKDVGLRERPDYSSMSLEERQKTIEKLRNLVTLENREDIIEIPVSQPMSDAESIVEDSPIASTSSAAQPLKKKKISLSTLDRLRTFVRKSQFQPAVREDVTDEVDRYFDSKYDDEADSDSDVLQWWRRNRKTYPALANIARKIFCIPASSASSERVFSAAGYIMQNRRSCLLPESVDSLLYTISNCDVRDFRLATTAAVEEPAQEMD